MKLNDYASRINTLEVPAISLSCHSASCILLTFFFPIRYWPEIWKKSPFGMIFSITISGPRVGLSRLHMEYSWKVEGPCFLLVVVSNRTSHFIARNFNLKNGLFSDKKPPLLNNPTKISRIIGPLEV
jgi:hypothetical protein